MEFLGITINYLKMCLSLPQTFLTIGTDASKKVYGAARHPIPTGGKVIYWNNDCTSRYWKKSSKTCIASTSQFQTKAVYFQIDNTAIQAYLVKMGIKVGVGGGGG